MPGGGAVKPSSDSVCQPDAIARSGERGPDLGRTRGELDDRLHVLAARCAVLLDLEAYGEHSPGTVLRSGGPTRDFSGIAGLVVAEADGRRLYNVVVILRGGGDNFESHGIILSVERS